MFQVSGVENRSLQNHIKFYNFYPNFQDHTVFIILLTNFDLLWLIYPSDILSIYLCKKYLHIHLQRDVFCPCN